MEKSQSSKVIGVPIGEADYAALATLAEKEDRPVGAMARIILLAFLQSRRDGPSQDER